MRLSTGLPSRMSRPCPRVPAPPAIRRFGAASIAARCVPVPNAQCPCCESRESETIQHTLFECEAFEEERKVFLSRLYSVCPLARQLNDEYRCRLVMGDKLPREIENPLYRYFIAISRLRLGILTERGEGS